MIDKDPIAEHEARSVSNFGVAIVTKTKYTIIYFIKSVWAWPMTTVLLFQ